jgi:formate/nitrite transporter FocA (FNT family)
MADSNNDAYAPPQIAQRVSSAGVAKAALGTLNMFVLAVLGGAFIALGAMFYAVVITGSNLGFGPTRLLGGLAFSLGLVLVIVAGAELFTGNNLIAMGWASRLVTTRQVLRNWGIVYLGNFVGALMPRKSKPTRCRSPSSSRNRTASGTTTARRSVFLRRPRWSTARIC